MVRSPANLDVSDWMPARAFVRWACKNMSQRLPIADPMSDRFTPADHEHWLGVEFFLMIS
jgi:hypothetical protein